MSAQEQAVILARICERTERMSTQLDAIEKLLFRGNGSPSLVSRVDALERAPTQRRSLPWRGFAALVLAIATGIAAMLGAWRGGTQAQQVQRIGGP